LDPVAYVVELVAESVTNPREKVRRYLESADYFWQEGLAPAERDLRQAGEKLWK